MKKLFIVLGVVSFFQLSLYAEFNIKDFLIQKCNNGSSPAGCMDVARWYIEGSNNVEKNHYKAKQFYKKGCDSGYAKSCRAYNNFDNLKIVHLNR